MLVRVPASTSNIGAGFDCLGLALDLWLEARLAQGGAPPLYTGTLEGFDPAEDVIAQLIGPLESHGLHLAVHSEIPVSRGLGSSAAAVVAGLALKRLLEKEPIDREALFHETARREGHPDNAGPAVFGGLVLSTGEPTQLTISNDLGIALAVPESGVDTREARAMLPRELPREVAIQQASSAAALLLGLTTGNGALIGFGMDDQIAAPRRKGLISGFDDAVAAGREAGAYGVTISGAGSTLVAVTPRDLTGAVAEAMASALTAHGNAAEPMTPAVTERGMELEPR